jgi:uncharacterized membrane protein
MPLSYNDIAGRDIARLSNLSDSIFGVGMTLLILELRLPVNCIQTERELWKALLELGPRFLVYFMSFITLGIFWNAQEVQLIRFSRSDRNLTWIHIAFLATVAITPFSTALEENFIHLRIALVVFWVNLLLLGLTLYASWQYASASGLLRSNVSQEERKAIEHHLVLAQVLYAVGFSLCVFNTLWSIVLIVLVQLFFAAAPTIRWFKRQSAVGQGDPHRGA